MARTGRPRKPTHLKIVGGNAGKRRIDSTEPMPENVAPSCPKQLKGEARKEWCRSVEQLLELNILTRVDRAALAGYCVAWARWLDAEQHLESEPMIIKSPNGYTVVSPWWIIANKALEQVNRFGTEFGFTPASRTRIKGSAAPVKKDKSKNPADRYFGTR